MCVSSSLVGVLIFVKKRSLLGEALSHAAYPGVVLSVLLFSLFFPYSEELLSITILIGAFISSLLGLYLINFIKKRWRISDDMALTFTLASFLGIGILGASFLQQTKALFFTQINLFLYGQVATMREGHVLLYAFLMILVSVFLIGAYHSLLAIHFDEQFSKSIGINVQFFEMISFYLFVLAIIIGIRTVGVILMSGMLIAPALAARQWTASLSKLFLISALFGMISAYFGTMLSIISPKTLILPPGPMIILMASALVFFSLLFSPSRGLFLKYIRRKIFERETIRDDILKFAWKNQGEFDSKKYKLFFPPSNLYLHYFLRKMEREGYLIFTKKKGYLLSPDGEKRALKIVRLHRLWEVYLFDYLGMKEENVHTSACEMEHILTPRLESELSQLLGDPRRDPHHQPIPRGDL